MSKWLSGGILAAAVFARGCGATNDVEEINRVVGAFGRAEAAGDGDRACALMMPEARRAVLRDNTSLGARDCGGVLRMVPEVSTDDQLRELRRLRLQDKAANPVTDEASDELLHHVPGLDSRDRRGRDRPRMPGAELVEMKPWLDVRRACGDADAMVPGLTCRAVLLRGDGHVRRAAVG